MTLCNGSPISRVLGFGLVCLMLCFDATFGVDCQNKYGRDWCSQGDAKIIWLPSDYPYPASNDTYRDECVVYDKHAKVTSIYSTSDCPDPIVGKLRPGQTNFFVGSNNGRNISVAFKVDKLQNWQPDSMVHYVFGECDVIVYIGNNGKIYIDYADSAHPGVSYHRPKTANELLLAESIAVGPQGISLSEHTPSRICYRDCNALNPDGTINFTQVIVKGTPSVKLSYISLGPEKKQESIFVKDDGSALIPKITVAGEKNANLTVVKTEYAKVEESSNATTTTAPSVETTAKDAFPQWAMILLIVLGVVLGLLLLAAIPAVFFLCKKSAAKKRAAAEKTQVQSTMGTVASQMTTAGSTMNDDQINVVVQN